MNIGDFIFAINVAFLAPFFLCFVLVSLYSLFRFFI